MKLPGQLEVRDQLSDGINHWCEAANLRWRPPRLSPPRSLVSDPRIKTVALDLSAGFVVEFRGRTGLRTPVDSALKGHRRRTAGRPRARPDLRDGACRLPRPGRGGDRPRTFAQDPPAAAAQYTTLCPTDDVAMSISGEASRNARSPRFRLC